MEFKDILRKLRTEKGLTLQQVADYVGLQKAAIYKYEHGLIENPKRSLIEKLATLFQVSPSYLLGIADQPQQHSLTGVRIPILGRVVAGIPLEDITDIEGYEEITSKLAHTGEFFALRIKGRSMEPRIEDGDIVICKRQSDVESGDIAVVLINGDEATCKQIKKSPEGITLIGFNPVIYPPHFYSNKEIEDLPITVIGRVVESRKTW